MNVARNKLIILKQTEISSWCLFSERFEDKVMLRSNDKKLTDQIARKQIYNEMVISRRCFNWIFTSNDL